MTVAIMSGPGVTTTAWLTALALGLAYSARRREACAQELRDAAGGDSQVLAAACRHLTAESVSEPAMREHAIELLRTAMRSY